MSFLDEVLSAISANRDEIIAAEMHEKALAAAKEITQALPVIQEKIPEFSYNITCGARHRHCITLQESDHFVRILTNLTPQGDSVGLGRNTTSDPLFVDVFADGSFKACLNHYDSVFPQTYSHTGSLGEPDRAYTLIKELVSKAIEQFRPG